jgi:hypothetical protein
MNSIPRVKRSHRKCDTEEALRQLRRPESSGRFALADLSKDLRQRSIRVKVSDETEFPGIREIHGIAKPNTQEPLACRGCPTRIKSQTESVA